MFEEAFKDISSDLGDEKAKRVTWLECDTGDWKGVTQVAKKISSSTERLDVLINDAARGIMTYQVAENGVDRHMAVNHIGHVILTVSVSNPIQVV